MKKKYSFPSAFLNDFYANDRTFCWLNHQLDELNQAILKNMFGFHVKEYREDLGFNSIIYKSITFPKGDDNLAITEIDNPSIASVISYAYNAKKRKEPYIIHAKRFWFVADSPFSYCSEQDRYIAFADVLHDIMGQNHGEEHNALVRIEDINALTDPASLLKTLRYLHSENIPFSVALVPVYIDPTEKLEIHLEDRPDLLNVLRKVPSYGGVFVMHGYTHQFHGVSTDDYEFWDDISDKPVPGDSVDYALNRIEKGLKECFLNGIYPFAWETPHYCGSQNMHLAVKKIFSHVYDRRNVMEYLGSDQFFPYVVKDLYGEIVIPENLGYIHWDHPETESLLNAAKLNLGVRDGYASFFYHVFVTFLILNLWLMDLENRDIILKIFGHYILTLYLKIRQY